MKEMTKKTAVVAMAGIMAAGMLTGCGEKKLDGSKTVATVDGTEIPLGVVSLSVRDGQMQTRSEERLWSGNNKTKLYILSIWRIIIHTILYSNRCNPRCHYRIQLCMWNRNLISDCRCSKTLS